MKILRGITLFLIRTIGKVFNYFRYIIAQLKRCINNNHNNTRLVFTPGNNYNNVQVGKFSYGPIDFRGDGVTKLCIGNYVAIASDVIFIANEHNTKFINQRDFNGVFFDTLYNKILNPCYKGPLFPKNKIDNKKLKGNIIIDDDVRIGTGAKIMSGVHIGQGAVIGAGAVVTKDIPPYAIVGGVPAKVIKYRFKESTIKKLVKINYKEITTDALRKFYPDLVNQDFDIDKILQKINK